ncbi:hypothetical protein COCON_G00202270 [Conger conger]|uniref:Uncharacterized protein n=1 Tax=Conger conger TaxID=82655 RepID=A0A9Q1CYC4_CONCO|nr:hypothetical protein COCON_G00202270 [Conger conger]
MECLVLATLRWDVALVTPQDFLSLREKHTGECPWRRCVGMATPWSPCASVTQGSSLVAAAALNSAVRGLANRGPPPGHVTTVLAALCRTDTRALSQSVGAEEELLTRSEPMATVPKRLVYRLQLKGEPMGRSDTGSDDYGLLPDSVTANLRGKKSSAPAFPLTPPLSEPWTRPRTPQSNTCGPPLPRPSQHSSTPGTPVICP